jgi:hypothetical protein
MIDDTNTTVMMYPSNKTISIADKNVSGVNIGTNGAAFATNTIQIGNSNSKINLSGNVGIGTTRPGYKLDVVGDTHCSGDVYIGNNNNNDFGGRIYFGGTVADNAYNHTQIVARKYQGGEGSELLIYKGNDADDRIRLKAYTIEFDIAGGGLDDYASSNIYMTLASNGCLGVGKRDPGYRLDVAGSIRSTNYIISNDRIGIQTESPGYPLQVNGGFLGYSYGTNGGVYFSRDSGTNWAGASKPVTIGIYCPNWYWSDSGFIASSDRRIKKNIIDIQDNEALVVFRKIQPKIYDYIDFLQKGGDSVYGFIAQEVKDVFPQAVKMIKGTIPNFYTMCPVSQDIITLDTTKLEYDASGQVFPKLRLYRENDVELIVQILSIDGNTVKIDKTLTENQVFVYGQEVDDFYALNKDAIWTLTTAALQEVDRQLQQEKQKTQTLQEEVQTLKQTCGLLQQNQDQLLSRIVALESK